MFGQKSKMRTIYKYIVMCVCLLAIGRWAGSAVSAQNVESATKDKTRMLLILNCSKSMWDEWQSDAKIKVTQQVLLRFFDSIAGTDDIEVALRVFGHLNKGSYSTKLEVPFEPNNYYKLQSKIRTLVPNGGNSTATALTESLNDFPATGATRNIIVIITDGIDDSDGDICQVARRVQLSGVVVQTFILGIGNPTDFRHSLDCAGNFTYLPDEADYTRALYDVFRRSEARARVLVELTDDEGMLRESIVPIALYDEQTGVVRYSNLYAVDDHYVADTLEVDPLVDYDITIFTHPEIRLSSQHFDAGALNRLTVKVEEGSLRLRFGQHKTLQQVPRYEAVVRSHGSSEILLRQDIGDQANLLAGYYDVDVLSQPVLHLENVEVKSGSKTDLEIPLPGTLHLTKPKVLVDGALFHVEEGRLEWVMDLNPNVQVEHIQLMPGDYQIVSRQHSDTKYSNVRNYKFRIESMKNTNMIMTN